MQITCKSHAHLLAALLRKSDWMWPWGTFGWRSLDSREFIIRTRGAVAWEWAVEGGLGGKVRVGRNGGGSREGLGSLGWRWERRPIRWILRKEVRGAARGKGWLAVPTLHPYQLSDAGATPGPQTQS